MNETPKLTPKSKFAKLHQWIKKHWISTLVILIAVFGAIVFFIVINGNRGEMSHVSISKKKPVEHFYSPLTGIEVSDKAATTAPVTAVMIENSPESRPQSGLKTAGVVYEAVAEGGITRFMALYQGSKPELIGPVRSLRMYYLDWATPYQASVAHVGGSYNALQTVSDGSHRDIDQSYNSGAYWRASDRYAPHNMYTSGAKLDELNAAKGYKESNFSSFERSNGKASETPDATSINVNFSSDLFNTSYAYDQASNTYFRSLAGEPHNDREAGQIAPSVIVVMKVSTQSRGGSDGYEDLVTSGSGQAYIFQNGVAREVTWKKDDHSSPLKLTDSEGKNVKLNRGQTWVAAITDRGSVSWQ